MNIVHELLFTLSNLRGRSTNHVPVVSTMANRAGIVGITIITGIVLATAGAVHGDTHETTAVAAIGLGSLNGPNGYRMDGRYSGDHAGSALSNAGDVNGDGLDDFIIGASTASPDGIQGAGEVYVIFGKVTNPPSLALEALNGTNGFRIVGATYNDETGKAVSGAGDVNHDGFADLIIGAPGADPNDLPEAGAACVVFGKPQFPARLNLDTINGTNGFCLTGIAENDRVGTSVANAGDVNGDGFDDILIGAPDAAAGGGEGTGQAYIVLGRSDFPARFELESLNGANGFQINGVAADSYAGKVVSSAGDINGDGYDDILLTAWKYIADKSLSSGTVYIVFGQADFAAKFNLSSINGTNGFRLEGISEGDNAGRSAVPAGDVNGDGRSDLVIGAPFATEQKGEAYVVFGQDSFSTAFDLNSLNGTNGFRLIGSEANGEAGTAVGAADVNGDGLEDVIVGASTAGTGSSRFAGKTYVVFGRVSFGPTITLGSFDAASGIQFDGAAAGDQSGQVISAAGDINGDGFDEFLIGAPNAGPGIKNDIGLTYLVQGGATLGVTLPVTHTGSPDDDSMNGTAGNDVMLGGRGHDQINAAVGNDALKGGSGDDRLAGGPGSDRLVGGNGHDTATYSGSTGGVTINLFVGAAGGGDAVGDHLRSIEELIGSATADNLVGDAQDNKMTGAGGDDSLTGGRGDDAFPFGPQSGDDTITDFTPGPESDDYLDFSPYPAITGIGDLNIQPQGNDTLITLPGDETIKLLGVAANALHPDDYRFAGAPLAKPDTFNTSVNTQLTINAPGVLANDNNPLATSFTAVLVATPTHGTATLQSSGAFSYVPVQNFVGVDEFTYRANNGQLSNVARVTINVTALPPTAADDAYVIELGETLNVAPPGVLSNDLNPGGLPLQAALVEQPINGSLAFNENGSFIYTPEVDFSTQDSFTYRANNGLASNIAMVTITILDPNGPPVAVDDSYVVEADKMLTVTAPGVLGNDVNPLPGSMSTKVGSKPAHGTLTLNANGSFTFTPQPGYKGQDSFTYQADNGQLSNEATVTLTIGSAIYNIQLPAILGD